MFWTHPLSYISKTDKPLTKVWHTCIITSLTYPVCLYVLWLIFSSVFLPRFPRVSIILMLSRTEFGSWTHTNLWDTYWVWHTHSHWRTAHNLFVSLEFTPILSTFEIHLLAHRHTINTLFFLNGLLLAFILCRLVAQVNSDQTIFKVVVYMNIKSTWIPNELHSQPALISMSAQPH